MLIKFPDKHSIWSELLQSNTERVFIATMDEARIGSTVAVSIVSPELPEPLVIEGVVLARRTNSARFASGVFVKFGERELHKCRESLGLTAPPRFRVEGRREERADCALQVRFRVPEIGEPCQARNISASGLLTTCPVDLAVGQEVVVTVALGLGVEATLGATVSWARNELHLVGVQFKDLSDEVEKQLRRAIERLSRPAETPVGGRAEILVADDDPDILAFLTKALGSLGHAAAPASRGDEALEAIRELRPKMVFLDVLMPGLDGLDVCKALRGDAAFAALPIVLLSALDASRLHPMADSAGATDYLSKPLALADLKAMVARYYK